MNTLLSKCLRLLFAATLGLVLTVSVVPTESASDHGCTTGYTCLYKDAGYSGGQIDFQWYIPNLDNFFFEGTYTWGGEEVSSTINLGTTYNACLFSETGGHGTHLELAKGNHTVALSRYYWNDKAKSAYFRSYTENWMSCKPQKL